jgi:hypothetical protein
MRKQTSFRLRDDALNQRLLARLKKGGVQFDVGKDGTIHYAPDDEEGLESNFIGPVRDSVFPSWQVLTCPPAWVDRYKQYMTKHAIPFRIEESNGELWFLLPGKYRPLRWKLEDSVQAERRAS